MKTLGQLGVATFFHLMSFVKKQNTYYDAFTEFLEVSKTRKTLQSFSKLILDYMAAQYKHLNPQQWHELSIEFSDRYYHAAIKDLYPLYKSRFSEAELRRLTKFYRSDIGTQYGGKNPQTQKANSLQLGASWAKNSDQLIHNILNEKGW